MQINTKPLLGIRGDWGLPEVVDMDDSLATSGDIPVENMDPRAYGYRFKHKHATIATGLCLFSEVFGYRFKHRNGMIAAGLCVFSKVCVQVLA